MEIARNKGNGKRSKRHSRKFEMLYFLTIYITSLFESKKKTVIRRLLTLEKGIFENMPWRGQVNFSLRTQTQAEAYHILYQVQTNMT